MRLTKLYIAGFGNLQDFTYAFSGGINVVSAPNGWGKSTFAAFLRAMFYGLGDSRARSVAENVRKRYTPWGGGSFGGGVSHCQEFVSRRCGRGKRGRKTADHWQSGTG